MKDIQTIDVTCECAETLTLQELTEFQGALKARTDDDVRRIAESIKLHGFGFPFFVWAHDGINHVLDGHGRILALHLLDEWGFLIPRLPVVYVNAKDDEEARALLLRLNSQYGKMTKESVLDFIGEYDFDLSDFALPCVDFSDLENIDVPTVDVSKDLSNQLQPMYAIEIDCINEDEQRELYNDLTARGIKCRACTR